MKEILDVLGWKIKGGAKEIPMSTEFAALGAPFDFKELRSDDTRVLVYNKPSRIAAITGMIQCRMNCHGCSSC